MKDYSERLFAAIKIAENVLRISLSTLLRLNNFETVIFDNFSETFSNSKNEQLKNASSKSNKKCLRNFIKIT